MNRLLKSIVVLLIVVFAVGFFSWNLFPYFVSSKLSEKAGVPVSIGHINFTFAYITVDDFTVGNPKGSILSKALDVEKTKANIPLSHFFHEEIVIPQMVLNDIYFSLEFDSKKSNRGNWTTIMNNLTSSLKQEKEGKEAKRRVLIEKLILKDLDIDLAYRDTGEIRKLRHIDRLELTNISSTGGIPSAQIMNIVIQETLRNIFTEEGLKNMLEGILKPNGGFFESIKKWF